MNRLPILALALPALGCFEPAKDDTGPELPAGGTSVSVTIDGSTDTWQQPDALFVEADQTDILTITDLATGQSTLELMVPDGTLPGTITSFEGCPTGSEQPTAPCGVLVHELQDVYDVVGGSYTVSGDPEPAGQVTGSFELELAHHEGTGTATVSGQFEADVGGF